MLVKKTRKIRYNSPEVTIMETRIQDIILSNSVTSHQVMIANDGVAVESFEIDNDPGFSTTGIFDIEF